MELHKPKYRKSSYGSTRDDRSSGYRGPRSDRSSRYNQGSTRFLKDRTPIHSRNNFGTTKYPLHRDESYQKNSRDNNSNSFYSTLRKKLFVAKDFRQSVREKLKLYLREVVYKRNEEQWRF